MLAADDEAEALVEATRFGQLVGGPQGGDAGALPTRLDAGGPDDRGGRATSPRGRQRRDAPDVRHFIDDEEAPGGDHAPRVITDDAIARARDAASPKILVETAIERLSRPCY